MRVLLVLMLAFMAMGCAIGAGGLTTGIDGCTSLSIEEGQLSVPAVFSANGKNLKWHKINEKCKGVEYHGPLVTTP